MRGIHEATVASAKLSDRLFNELHFSDPVLFDAKYLAGRPPPRSFLKDVVANWTRLAESNILRNLM